MGVKTLIMMGKLLYFYLLPLFSALVDRPFPSIRLLPVAGDANGLLIDTLASRVSIKCFERTICGLGDWIHSLDSLVCEPPRE